MAVSIVLTGTGQNCTLTSGQNTITVTSTTGLVVGATIQGTGIPTGTRIGKIVGTTVTLVNASGVEVNATVTGTQSLIFSSVWGSVLTITMSASGDYATPQNIYNAGFGILQDNTSTRQLLFAGSLGVIWRDMVAGSVFDFQNWVLEFGNRGYWAWSQSSIFGELRGGYLVNGTQFIKSSGPTFISNNFKNATAGGSNMFIDTATGAMTGTFRMNDLRIVYQVGANTAPFFVTGRMNCIVDNMILDYQGGSGANASIGAAYGTINNTTIVRANSGIQNPNLGIYANINGLSYSGIYTDSPNHKFSIPNNYVLEGYAPQVLSTQLLGGFQDGTTETYANIDLSSAGWGLNDLKTKYLRYGGNNVINFPRRVSFQFNDSIGEDLTGVTLFIRSGATSLINAVQSGDYSANTQALVLNWNTVVASYRVATSIIDTIAQVAQFRKNGFISQSVSYSLNTSDYSQPIFMLADPAYGNVTPEQAAALTGITIDFTNKLLSGSNAKNIDELYAFGQYTLALTANSAQADYQVSNGGTYNLLNTWKLYWTAGALTMGNYNKTFNSSTQWKFGNTASLTLDKDDVVWTPALRADLFQFENGSTFNITNGSILTVSPTAGLGYGTATTSEFRANSVLNMSDSTVIYNVVNGGAGTVFSNSEANATWNISNSIITLNCPNNAQVAIHAYFKPESVINGLTVNGTATNVVWQMGYTTNNSKMVGFKYGGAIFGNGTSNCLMDTYTYTGVATTIPSNFGSSNKWYWVDPVMQAGGLFRYSAGSTPTGNAGFYGIIGFRPTIIMDKVGYAPKGRIKASALTSRYPTKTFNTTEFGTVPLSEFFRDPTFMSASDGYLPFIDSLDDKTVLNTINWNLEFRQAGYIDQSSSFLASNAKKGLVTYTASGAVDSNYVNASTAVADLALISVNTSTKTIAPVSGNLSWSPQRLYNALKQWWATYASDVDFLALTGSGTLDLGDYNTSSTLKFTTGNTTDSLKSVKTTGLINAPVNDISVTDANGTSTIWEFGNTSEPVLASSSIALYDNAGATIYYNAVTSDGVYRHYIPSGATGTYTYAIEKYGTKREEGTFPSNAGGILFYVPSYGEDVGITETNLATVQSYTTLSTTSQIYDATANFRLSETGIKLGQLVARDGTFLDFGNYNVKIKDDASAIVGVASGIITYKSLVINESLKYNAMKATPPKTITVTDNELINVLIEDANGDSQLTILGGDNLGYELWKVTTATATDDYATGTLLTTLATNALPYRFIGISGFDIVGRDVSSGVRRRTSMLKGSYEQAFYVGNQIQLATDAPQLIENNEKLAEVILKLDTNLDAKVSTRLADADYIDPATPQQIWEYTDRTLTSGSAGGATLAEIEGSTILAKKAQIDSVETKVDALPTLSEIEATTVLFKAADYVAPDNTKISEIKTKVDSLENTDLTGVEADLVKINLNVKDASLFIPATRDL